MENKISEKFILKHIENLVKNEPNWIANLSNASALLKDTLDQINWVGFYLWDEETEELVLGPFQGRVACIRIASGKGVCGTAFEQRKTLVVPDVNEFPGHIFCDTASQSEIVVPLIKDGKAIGVLDVDAPIKNRFGTEEKELLESFVEVFLKYAR
ncbi:MAG TPA: GAF domain-containing protein [Candidatus Atopostipes pullistercoris]|uniref:GAF domain-containing protein n=1 Tax=Candidatus Atopostipes pullistercoris TaxID=2838467 RepID=A0A9D2G1C0_9LACT|nr:GAF domain-containing protein [Candidatus Atopostipes pullistercoris]